MKTRIVLSAGFAAVVTLWSGAVLGQSKPAGCDQAKAGTPQKVEGQVVKVDPDRGKLTLRGTDGTTREFEASKETLQGYTVGDRIEAQLRLPPNCR